MKREIVSYNVNLQQGVAARFYVNDLPLFDQLVEGQRSRNGGLNDRLVPGENELRIELLWAEDSVVETPAGPPVDEMDRQAREERRKRLSALIFKAAAGGGDELDMIHEAVFPDWWADVEPEHRRLPYHYVATFDPGVDVYELAFLAATPVDVPCQGTAELRALVEDLHQCFVAGDKTKLIDLMSLQLEEFAKAFEGGGVSMAEQIEAYDEFFDDDFDVLPLEGELLHFTPRSGGRVIEVTRTDDRPVIVAVTRTAGFSHTSNPLLIHHGGRWRLM
ncbi:MAG: hypothetical protein JRI68_28525 [Deltaproteobacteria bacterium]|nr:hypothetical protein [Deltaproteobacteria bacterium]